jgi:hypothetical protein
VRSSRFDTPSLEAAARPFWAGGPHYPARADPSTPHTHEDAAPRLLYSTTRSRPDIGVDRCRAALRVTERAVMTPHAFRAI